MLEMLFLTNELEVPKDDVDVLMEVAGCGSNKHVMGNYQLVSVFLLTLCIHAQGILIYGMPLYEKVPSYEC